MLFGATYTNPAKDRKIATVLVSLSLRCLRKHFKSFRFSGLYYVINYDNVKYAAYSYESVKNVRFTNIQTVKNIVV